MNHVQSYLSICQYGDDEWELYNKKLNVLWYKIKIELDDTLSLPLEDVQIIHDIAKKQGDNYYDDYYHLSSMINAGTI